MDDFLRDEHGDSVHKAGPTNSSSNLGNICNSLPRLFIICFFSFWWILIDDEADKLDNGETQANPDTSRDFTVKGQMRDLNTVFLKLRIEDVTGFLLIFVYFR